MLSDGDPTLRAPSRDDDPSLTAAIAALRAIATEPLTAENCRQLTGTERDDVVLVLRALELEAVRREVAGEGEVRL